MTSMKLTRREAAAIRIARALIAMGEPFDSAFAIAGKTLKSGKETMTD